MKKQDGFAANLPPVGVSFDVWAALIAEVARGRIQRKVPLSALERSALAHDDAIEKSREIQKGIDCRAVLEAMRFER